MSADHGFTAFVGADERIHSALVVLAGAESLTDDLALDLLGTVGVGPPEWQVGLVGAVHACDFVVDRNDGWHLAPAVRAELVEQLAVDPELSFAVHRRLLELAVGEGTLDGVLPAYLSHDVGVAYHGPFAGHEEALRHYVEIAEGPADGFRWLAARLAEEQIRLGIVAPESPEVHFLLGMEELRAHDLQDGLRRLGRIAESDAQTREVAVATYVVGVYILSLERRYERARREAVAMLRRSARIGAELGDRAHVERVLKAVGSVALSGDWPAPGGDATASIVTQIEDADSPDAEMRLAAHLRDLAMAVARRPDGTRTAAILMAARMRLRRLIEDPSGRDDLSSRPFFGPARKRSLLEHEVELREALHALEEAEDEPA